MKGNPAIDPDDVTVPEEGVGAGQREGHPSVRRPRSGLEGRGHGLPDGVDAVGRGSELEYPAEEQSRQLILAHPGTEQVVDLDHRRFVDRLGGADARQLVDGLAQSGWPEDGRRREDLPVGQPASQRMGHVVEREPGPSREKVGQHTGRG